MECEIRRYLREGESYVRNRAIADIERTREGLFELRFFKNGKPVQQNLRAVLKQTDLDFNFGANIFMLDSMKRKKRIAFTKKSSSKFSIRRLFRSTGKAQSRRKGICATTVAHPTMFTAVYLLWRLPIFVKLTDCA